jgi:hypothetical protein
VTGDQRRAVAYGLIVVTAFVVIDVALGAKAAISGSYALGAILSGVMGGFRPAVPVAVVAVVLSGRPATSHGSSWRPRARCSRSAPVACATRSSTNSGASRC